MALRYLKNSDSVAIVSGGLDSTTLVYHMLNKGMTPRLLSFNYGQRHKKELQYAENTARTLSLQWDLIDLTGITHLISNSALTSPNHPYVGDNTDGSSMKRDIEVPDGHYAEETMKATVVPNRNMIMLAIATGVAVSNNLRCVGIGVHAGDHFIYPDCRSDFIRAMEGAILLGNEGFGPFTGKATDARLRSFLYAPFISRSKADIAYKALDLGVPLHMTWSCYKGGEKHCGRCGTCVERLEAISRALDAWNDVALYGGIQRDTRTDYTEYEDNEFWKTQVKRGPRSTDLHTA